MVNWLIGQGESLVQRISLSTGGGEKAFPYSFDEAFQRLESALDTTASSLEALPSLACPNDEAVVGVTLNPAFLAKTYHPTNLLSAYGLRQVGSREAHIVPDKVAAKSRQGEEFVSTELFIAGPRRRLVNFARGAKDLVASRSIADDFRKIEEIRPLGEERLKRVGEGGSLPLEIVLHADIESDWGASVLRGFKDWCAALEIDADLDRRQHVGGLTFLGLHASAHILPDLVKFAFARAIRRMPKLSFRELQSRAMPLGRIGPAPDIILQPLISETRVAIFDGGLPLDHPFGDLVQSLDAPNLSGPVAQALDHGCQVTSALLFGHVADGVPLPAPYCPIDHWRVIDDTGDDFELMNTLTRIADVLTQHQYQVVNLSLGPDEAILDDDVHLWTARLDQLAATGQTLIVCAAGNNGELDEPSGLCRIQPPGDGVNLLSVGASNCADENWERASYSAKGSGRSPGFIKPDVLAFGGSKLSPYATIDASGGLCGTMGTSFAAPTVSRLASGLNAVFGSQLNVTSLKALLVQNADPAHHNQVDVGWGHIPAELDQLAVCPDDEATVIYQGVLEPSRFMRFPLPMPTAGFQQKVSIRATFVFTTDVDPEDTVSYTRTGLGVTFRPSTVGHPGYHSNGKARSTHPSRPFFGKSSVFQTEQELRDDALRWETVLRAQHAFKKPALLQNPVFDVEHLTRAHGHNAQRPSNIPYSLIVTVKEKGNSRLYNDIITSYGGRLTAMVPQVEVPIRTQT